MRLAILALAVVSACGDPTAPTQEIQFGPLEFEVTADWVRKDTSKPGWASSMFTPIDNNRLESVTVIRSRRADSTSATLEQLLVTAQQSLRDVRILGVRRMTTARGLVGAKVDVSFTPESMTQPYHRTHVVLSESGSTLVHVVYTAKVPDEAERTLHVVLDSIRVAQRGGRS